MFDNIPNDCMEIILRNSDIETYYNSQLVNKNCYNMIGHMRLGMYFAKNRLKKQNHRKIIKFCTNAKCPNKLHIIDTAITNLKEKDLDIELMMEYKKILSGFRKGHNDTHRFDKTVTYEYMDYNKNINKGFQLDKPIIPYCEDCLLEYNPKMYTDDLFID